MHLQLIKTTMKQTHVQYYLGGYQLEVIEDIRAIRTAVFIQEQQIPESLEFDGLDEQAIHVLAFVENQPVGTARMLADGHIGRVAVLPLWRGQNIGTTMLKTLIAYGRDQNFTDMHLGAQCSALPFYQRLGFKAYGETFMEANMPHQHMRYFFSSDT